MRNVVPNFGFEPNETGSAVILHCLFLFLFLFYLNVLVLAGTPIYKGIINYFDTTPNQMFTLDDAGNMTLGNTFNEGNGFFHIDPTGNLLVATDQDFLTTKTVKWYRVEDDGFVKSPQELPTSNDTLPILWTPTPYRVILGSDPLRVWALDPFSLKATLLSEFSHPDIISWHAAITPDLNKLFLGYPTIPRTIAELNYDNKTGVTTGPVILISTPELGTTNLLSTSDGRTLIQHDGSYITILKVLDDASTTITQHIDLWKASDYTIRGVDRSLLSDDDKYLFLIALDNLNVLSFELTTSGTIELINAWSGFPLAQAMALTPDGEFLVVAHSYFVPGPPAKLSVFRVGVDGTLDYLEGKDIILPDTPYDIAFFPPHQPIPRPMSWRIE